MTDDDDDDDDVLVTKMIYSFMLLYQVRKLRYCIWLREYTYTPT